MVTNRGRRGAASPSICIITFSKGQKKESNKDISSSVHDASSLRFEKEVYLFQTDNIKTH